MSIKAIHVFGFQAQAKDGRTLARCEESWQGLLASPLRGYRRKWSADHASSGPTWVSTS